MDLGQPLGQPLGWPQNSLGTLGRVTIQIPTVDSIESLKPKKI